MNGKMDVIKKWSEKKVLANACKCFDHPLFILFAGAVATLFYMLNIPVYTLIVFALCGCFIFLFCEDTRPAIPLALFLVISLRFKQNFAAYRSKGAMAVYFIFGSMLLITILYRLAMRRVEWTKKGGLLGIALFSGAVLFGGVFTEYYSLDNFVNAVMIALILFLPYAFFAFTLKKREDNLVYLARTCAVAICMIALQLVEIYALHYKKGISLDMAWKDGIIFGWAISNMGGEMIAFLMPALFYLIYKEKYGWLYYFVVAVGVLSMYFILGRNALLWGGFASVCGIAANCFVGKNKTVNRIIASALVALILVGVVLLAVSGKLHEFTIFFRQEGLNDHGRYSVWEGHFRLFTLSPLHGVGYRTYALYDLGVGKAHNNILQMLCSSGVLGLVLYGMHRVQTIYSIAKKPTADRLFMGGCILVGVAMGMLSSTFFHVYFLMYYSIILLVLEKE